MKILSLIFSFFIIASCATRDSSRHSDRSGTRRPVRPTQVARHTIQIPVQQSTSKPLPDGLTRAIKAEQDGQFLEAIREYADLMVSTQDSSRREAYQIKALDLLETRLDESDLRRVANGSSFGVLRGYAFYELGSIYLDRRDTDYARKAFSGVSYYAPDTEIAFRANEMVSQLDSIRFVDSKTIGVVLPLSGKNAAMGQRALRAIEMGLGLNDAGSPFKLAIADSEGNPDIARRAVERLVKEDSVIAIIGSLLSRTAPAVAAKANELGVPTIALSQKAGVTEIGSTVFRNALTSEMQVRQLVKTAIDEMGLRRFAILYPNDAYGTEYANIFWDEVMARGGVIAAAQVYNPSNTDFRGATQRLVGTWYIEGRKDEFDLLSKERQTSSKRSIRQSKTADDLLPPIVDFDAIFIPDSSKILSQMAAFLSYAGVKNVKLLGTNLWNSANIGKRAGAFADKLVYVDGLLPQQSEAGTKFANEYKDLFGDSLTTIELQSFDSALLLRSLIGQGVSTREALTRRLTSIQSFPGVVGPLFMSQGREIRRPLASFVTDSQGTPSVLKSTR